MAEAEIPAQLDTPLSVPVAGCFSQTIESTAERLKGLTQRSQQAQWHQSPEPYALTVVFTHDSWRQWPLAALNSRGHIPWPRGKQPLWLCQTITVPQHLNGFSVAGMSLRLGLTWWAESAQIYVDGTLVQRGDLFDCFTRILLSDRVSPGNTFTVGVFLLSPGHDEGALVRAEVIYEAAPGESPEPGFIADELMVLKRYAEKLAPEKLPAIAAAIAPLDWSLVSQGTQFQAELAALRQRLLPLSPWIKQRQLACVGHAHLDLAWLWPVEDTWQAAERTFASVLALQQSFPELTYTHSSPALFDWLENHRPALFQQVIEAVKAGRWAIDAGLWVEPELNVTGGESLTRQILWGQRYCQSRFGAPSAIAWLPDSFGFSWQLPQLLTLGQVRYFATQKLRWNDTTAFPYSLFWWQGLDGTRMFSLTLPPIGSDLDPVQMATHGAAWEAQTGLSEALWLPGMGDHGGGPTRDMLETARRWSQSPFFPTFSFTSVAAHLAALTNQAGGVEQPTSGKDSPAPNSPLEAMPSLPTWQDELYLELHRGCYTVHADQKWFNRRCEDTLREAEMFAAIGQLQGVMDYPKADLERAWKQALFNQFHDILPGTAIPAVFATANAAWQSAYDSACTIRDRALQAIAHQSPLPSSQAAAIPLWVFNALAWERTDIVEIALNQLPEAAQAKDIHSWKLFESTTQTWLPCQVSHHTISSEIPPGQPPAPTEPSPHLLFLATLPPVGYRVFWLIPSDDAEQPASVPAASARRTRPWQLANNHLQAIIDPETGHLIELRHQGTHTDLINGPANQLQAFQDAGQYWDAWDIAPDYADHPLPAPQLQSIQWLEQGPLRQRLRVIRTLNTSVFQQDYVLDQHASYLKVETVADWHETQVVLKVAFPLALTSEQATYEIPFGAIARSTHSPHAHAQAKWEVPALRWADVSTDQHGLSILTDYKHGFDVQPSQLRLTLLKAPLWPDPSADRGRHVFTYALYPHRGDWRTGKTPQVALAFNSPLRSVLGRFNSASTFTETTSAETPETPSLETPQTSLPALAKSFLDLGTNQVGLAAFKPAEDLPNDYVLRCWDLYGEGAELEIKTAWGSPDYRRTNLLEEEITVPDPTQLTPWQIATLKLSGPEPSHSNNES